MNVPDVKYAWSGDVAIAYQELGEGPDDLVFLSFLDLDMTDVMPAIRVPTLVIAKERLRDEAERVAAGIPDCEFVAVPGDGGAMQENDYPVEAIEAFLAGAPQHHIPDTVLATVLFTDVVGSTQRAAELGDDAWRDLLGRHNAVVRRELERFGGVELDTAGDGFLARFEGRSARSCAPVRSSTRCVRSASSSAQAFTRASAAGSTASSRGSP